MSDKIKVLVVDDNSLLRLGICEAISNETDMEVVGEAKNGTIAIQQFEELKPDVVTMDYKMPNMNGVEATQIVTSRFPDARILILSVYEREEDVWSAVKAGAKGYLYKSGEIEEVLEAIREVSDGHTYFPASISQKISRREGREELTPREFDILQLMSEGKTNREIMGTLHISEGTVKLYVSRVLEKLGVKDRTQAALIAVKQGIVPFTD